MQSKTKGRLGEMTGKNEGLFFSEAEDMGNVEVLIMGNAEVLNSIFASVFISRMDLQESQVPKTLGSGYSKEDAHWCDNQAKPQ